MSGGILLAVLGAALLHGTWNALAKLIPDRLVSSALIGLAYLLLGGLACLVLPLPAAGAPAASTVYNPVMWKNIAPPKPGQARRAPCTPQAAR